jgi:RNA polymerase sigma-70 factor (ECF subfamily)
VSTHDPAEGADHPAEPGTLPPPIERHADERAAARRAFSCFYRDAIKPLIAYLIVSGAPASVAAEIAQECMIGLFKHWGTVSYPRAYVYQSAGRMWGRKVASVRMEEPVEELPEPTSLVPKPDALTEAEERHEILQVLKSLPPRQRQVLFLTLERFTPVEIAAQLELDPGTVRAHLMRARRAAATMLREREEQ